MRNFILITSIVLAIGLGYFATTAAPKHIIIGFAAILISILAFLSPKASLFLLIFSMLLSPEISLGALTASRDIVFRYDDILLVIIFFSWFARTAIMKDKSFVMNTPAQTPILIFTIICVVSTAFGILRGDVNYLKSFFYVLKYVEYFLLYFMVVNIVETEEDIKKYLYCFAIVAIIVTIYALFYYYMSPGHFVRASAPFEAPFGMPEDSEPASLGGYYLILFSIFIGMISEGSLRLARNSLIMIAVMFPAFLFTFSRASYIGLVAAVIAFFIFSKKRKVFMTGLLIVGFIAVTLIPGVYGKVKDRITMTYQGVYANVVFDMGSTGQIKLEQSAALRIYSLKKVVFQKLPKHPFLGWGVTGIGMGDVQYALLLGEIGLIGFFIFFWMIYRIYRASKDIYLKYDEGWIKGFSLGMILALVALLAQGVGVNTFIIVRIMEPFWFLVALMMVLFRNKDKSGNNNKVLV
ncbi:MAG: O-antigen ligase family protein [Elusimicrobiota bacterium]|nr:O-antigen ligase family protein [Elusimicrobiota bacterium]